MKNYPEDIHKSMISDYHWKSPSGRLGIESEVSAAVVFLLSPAASYINGTTLRVDGGSSLHKSGGKF